MARKTNIVSFDEAKSKSHRGSAAPSIRSGRGGRVVRTERTGRVPRAEREERNEGVVRSVRDARSDRKRERAKARADKMFAKQLGESSAPSDASAEGAPRPALYKAKMGSAHKKSARMQRSSSAGSSTARVNASGWFASIPLTARRLKVGTAILCVFLACAFLYSPAQQYYQAQREHDRLSAEYSSIEERNEALDVQNDILASDAGMEDAVRQKYGYVRKGEQVAVVTGLSEHAADSSRAGENIEASVLSGSVRAPEEWYTPFLDAFFGVE